MNPAMTLLLGWSPFPLCTNVSPEAPHQPSLLYLRINPHLPSSCLSCPSCNPGTDVPPLRGTSSGPLRRQSSNQSLCNETQRRCHLRSLSPSPSNWHCWQDELHVRGTGNFPTDNVLLPGTPQAQQLNLFRLLHHAIDRPAPDLIRHSLPLVCREPLGLINESSQD
jgi:hypothetical protein